jgi:coenzyme F420-reducing hydrogenase delta subunit
MARECLVYLFVCKTDIRKKLIDTIKNKYNNIKVIDTVCAGKINPSMLLKIINNGAEGIIVLGCNQADCHYREGNLFSERRFYLTKKLLEGFGFNQDKLQILWHKPTSVIPVLDDIDKFLSSIKDESKVRGNGND